MSLQLQTSPLGIKVLEAINDSPSEWLKATDIADILGRGKKKEIMLRWVQDTLAQIEAQKYILSRDSENLLGNPSGIKEYTLTDDLFFAFNFDEHSFQEEL